MDEYTMESKNFDLKKLLILVVAVMLVGLGVTLVAAHDLPHAATAVQQPLSQWLAEIGRDAKPSFYFCGQEDPLTGYCGDLLLIFLGLIGINCIGKDQ